MVVRPLRAGWMSLNFTAVNKAAKKITSGLTKFATKQLKGSGVLSWVKKFLEPLTEAADSSGSGDSPAPKGSHKHWLEQAGIPKSWFNSISEIIDAESGWRVNASNGQYQGIPQTTVANLRAAGSDWRTNPITQLKAMKKYISGRYGNANKALAFRRVHNWYANGGLSQKEKLAHISEGNMPEMVIPLSKLKSSRGYELLGKTAAIMAKRDHLEVKSSNDNKSSDKLMDKLDQVIGLMQSLLVGQQNPTPAVVSANDIYSGYNQVKTKKSLSKNLGRGYVNGIQ